MWPHVLRSLFENIFVVLDQLQLQRTTYLAMLRLLHAHRNDGFINKVLAGKLESIVLVRLVPFCHQISQLTIKRNMTIRIGCVTQR